jgi:type I restriction enzyme S subunit
LGVGVWGVVNEGVVDDFPRRHSARSRGIHRPCDYAQGDGGQRMKAWPTVPLGEVLKTHIDAVPTSSLTTVNLAGVFGFGRGLFRRGETVVAGTTYKNFHRLHADDFVISSPKAWEGAIARVSKDFDGWFLSPVFPTFRADKSRLDTQYLDWYCKREAVWRELQFKAKGMGARRESVSSEQFLSLEIPLPPLPEQHAIVTKLDELNNKTRQLTTHLDTIDADADRLLALRFRDAITNAPYRPMSEVAPLVRREVEIDAQASYTELGVRSFYKGTFHRRTVLGAEFTWQKMFCIQQGDLIFSNIMAWEQAIALAKPEDTNCLGNHRMLTCVANPQLMLPEFLAYYFTTDEGFADIYAASPGTAARNRTLIAGNLQAIQVPVPPLEMQHEFVALQAIIDTLKTKHTTIRQSNAALSSSMLEQVFNLY